MVRYYQEHRYDFMKRHQKQQFLARFQHYRIIQALGGQCQNCGSQDHLHIHHPLPKGEHWSGVTTSQMTRVPRYLIDYEIGEPLTVLCRSCHQTAHGELDPPEKRERRLQQAREAYYRLLYKPR